MINIPFKYGPDKEGHMEDCIKYYMGKVSKRTGKRFTKDEAGAVCATIARKQEALQSARETEDYIRIRMKDPSAFQEDSFKTIVLSEKEGIKAVIGRLKGETTTTVQVYLFDKSKWTVEKAKAWIRQHKKNAAEEQPSEGRFTLSLHQLGNEKHFDLYLEKEGYCENFAFVPVKVGLKNVLKNGDRAQKRNPVILRMLDFTGIITIGKPGATKDFPGVIKVLEMGTYITMQEEGGVFRYKFEGKKLNGVFELRFDTEKLQENYKYRYIFSKIDEKDQLIEILIDEIAELSLQPERTQENLEFKQNIGVLKELLQNGNVVPLTIKGIALKEGIWNGLFYPYEEIKKRAQELVGKALLIDHGKSVRDIVGKVTGVTLDDVNRLARFEAQITDESIARKVLEGLVDSVSVGVIVDRMKEGRGLTARNYEFKELSIVLVPACTDAKIKEVIPPVVLEQTSS